MRIAILIIIILHGLIHMLGFVKAFEISDIKELSLPISKTIGLLWLAAAMSFLVYAVLYLIEYKYAWLIGCIAVIISQFLIIAFWKDAKFGTLGNVLVLITVLMSFGQYCFHKKVKIETAQLFNSAKIETTKKVTEDDISTLPEPVKKWLSTTGIIGKPYIKMGKVYQKAEMKIKPDQKKWMKATAIQYSFIDKPAFIWMTNVKMNSLLHFRGRDKLIEGKGEMLIRLNAILNIVNEKGPKIDEGSIQRYLGEMVWFPSLALSPYITWETISETAAKATIEYKGTKGSGVFYFNSNGDFIKFSTLRFKGNEKEDKRFEWVLSVKDYKEFEGIRVPAEMTATWKLNEGDWTWLKLELIDINYNTKE